MSESEQLETKENNIQNPDTLSDDVKVKTNIDLSTETNTNGSEKSAIESSGTGNCENSEISEEVVQKIINQVEYYFGNENLSRDGFLRKQIGQDSGWVLLKTMLTFKRLSALTNDENVLATTIKKSTSGFLELNEDNTKIRRTSTNPVPEFNEESQNEMISRTAYLKGFPLHMNTPDIIDFLLKYKPIHIHPRRFVDKKKNIRGFKGSVLVTFPSKEKCDEFLKLDKVEYNGKTLIRMWQSEYIESKKNESKSKKKGSFKKNVTDENKSKQQQQKIDFPKGAVLSFSECKQDTSRELIKDAVKAHNIECAYIDYARGQPNGYLRLLKENTAKELFDKLSNGMLKLDNNTEIKMELISDEKEKEYLKSISDMIIQRNQRKRKPFHRGSSGIPFKKNK